VNELCEHKSKPHAIADRFRRPTEEQANATTRPARRIRYGAAARTRSDRIDPTRVLMNPSPLTNQSAIKQPHMALNHNDPEGRKLIVVSTTNSAI